MGKPRKHFSKEYKAKVAIEALKELKTSAELSSELGVHATQINQWKRELQEALPEVFSKRKSTEEQGKDKLIDDLYRQIGQLQVENGWLKKKLPL